MLPVTEAATSSTHCHCREQIVTVQRHNYNKAHPDSEARYSNGETYARLHAACRQG